MGFVDFSGGDISESETLKEVLEGIKGRLQGLFENWDERFLKRTLARFAKIKQS